jgi:integrase
VLTVGVFIKTATGISSARSQSIDAYTKAFRRIVSEVKGIPNAGKFVARGSHAADWRNKVDAVALATVSPAEVTAWKNKRLREAEADPIAKRRAVVTVNSLIRNAKALFGKKILPFIEQSLKLPSPLPFDGVTLEKPPSMRYVSKIDPYALLATAREALAESDPEAFKVLVLALVCGLRRSEIDNLLWRAFDFPASALRVETSEFHQLKSEDSAGVIDLDADTLALFRSYRARHSQSIFVIESTKQPRTNTKARDYRCEEVFKRVLSWLRAQGVESMKPLHTLRKEIGSIIASEHGIFEASRYLRHSDIRITSAIYADKKKVVTPKAFAGLLGNQSSVTEEGFKGSGEAPLKKALKGEN